ncbi:hypothetical protein EUGRSUZ_B01284 [Eucalyptus grandis]|uniref:Uncharacterized protein n=2 Tax=Eucalyptus grandis TaxID=71139 RepID=A0ACC3LQB2_EUCGR|nr:hypothetical protein EUGRSUZ_B01284 [Eucalyptus grandis]
MRALLDAFRLLNAADPSGVSNKPALYGALLQTCAAAAVSFGPGLQIHARVIKSGLDTDGFVGNSLITLYFKSGSDIGETRRVFDGLFAKDVISWTSMISGYVKVGQCEDSLKLFWDMLGTGIEPNCFTLSAVIKACSGLGRVRLGWCFHGVVFRHGFGSNRVISSALIDMYGRNCCLNEARRVFDELPEPDAICWTSVISAYTRNDIVLTACGNLGWLKQGKQVHSKVITFGLCGHVVVESSIVDMYGKCRSLDEAQHVFDRMINKNSVSLSALLGGYCQGGKFETVIQLFREMGNADLYDFGTVIRACAGLAAVRPGKEVHCQYVRRVGWRDVVIESALVDLYAKCGCTDFSYRIFVRMHVKNLITWNSMICGFAQNGRDTEALEIFDEMAKSGVRPDYISFVGVLFACSQTGLVDQGRKYFTSMTEEYGIKAGTEHYNCMVDLLGRAGLLEEAEKLVENAEYRDDPSLWEVLLSACTTSTNSASAERIAKKILELKPDHHLSYVVLANVYRSVGRWSDALQIRSLMEDKKIKKMPAMSWT